MPKELTHWILAERAAKNLCDFDRMRDLILANRAAFLAGAVLPDTLLYLFYGPHSTSALDLARRFHNPGGSSYAPLIRVEAGFSGDLPPDILACILGVISHMQADIVLHPFVYSLTGKRGIGEHYRVETAMDVRFLLHGESPPVRRLADLLNPAVRKALIDLAAPLFDPEGRLPRKTFNQAITSHCRIQGMYDRTLWKMAAILMAKLSGPPGRAWRHLFYPFFLSRKDALMMKEAGGWRHPVTGETMETTLDDLAAEAVRRTVMIFGRIDEMGGLSAALGDLKGENLLTGMYGVDRTALD